MTLKPVKPQEIGRLFGDLKIRPKLMVLHNLFFLVLTAAVYFSVIPLFERRVESAREREYSLVAQMMEEERLVPSLKRVEAYRFKEGPAMAWNLPPEVLDWLRSHPGRTFHDPKRFDTVFRLDPSSGAVQGLEIPDEYYQGVITRARYTLFLVLGIVYGLAILLLEMVIMPTYVYGPVQLVLHADAASLSGDVEHELVPDPLIMDDEIGQIMRSRNSTVAMLRQRNEQLEAARKKLLEQDRLASLGLLSASVAHELNTPLAVLEGSIEKLMEKTEDSHALDRLARMSRMTQRLRRISESLVGFSRVRRESMEKLDAHGLIEEAWHLAAMEEKSGQVTFRNELQPGELVVGNSDRLMQVFLNLLRNALQATPVGGTISVRGLPLRRDGEDWLAIRVEDTGPGIPPEVLPDIFDAFVSTRLDANGTGLGLTVAEGIVNQHGGTISAANRPEGGACLEVTLRAAHNGGNV